MAVQPGSKLLCDTHLDIPVHVADAVHVGERTQHSLRDCCNGWLRRETMRMTCLQQLRRRLRSSLKAKDTGCSARTEPAHTCRMSATEPPLQYGVTSHMCSSSRQKLSTGRMLSC